jgi:hypothetical protein
VLLFVPSEEAKSNVVSVNGVAPLAVESCTEAKVTDVECHPVGEENEIHVRHEELRSSGKDDKGTKQLYYLTFKDTKMVMYFYKEPTRCNFGSIVY